MRCVGVGFWWSPSNQIAAPAVAFPVLVRLLCSFLLIRTRPGVTTAIVEVAGDKHEPGSIVGLGLMAARPSVEGGGLLLFFGV